MQRIISFINTIRDLISGYKTYAICASSIIYAIAVIGYQNKDWGNAVTMILAALGGASLRAGIAKNNIQGQ
jgi:small-conductance mechanosensitive channel